MEKETGKNVFTILQLRLHPAIISLKEKISKASTNKKFEVNLKYITSRGNWYHNSWKGDIQKSGGVATNIGVHFFDMLLWIFGDVVENNVTEHTFSSASGNLKLEKANVNWMLSIDAEMLPKQALLQKKRTHRSLEIDGEEFDFNEGFAELHTLCYKDIIAGKGFTLSDVKKSIKLVHQIRNQEKQ
jgi:UDP-N-acetyl-2-amino-2-deoxyglucuronate dehydrogenase